MSFYLKQARRDFKKLIDDDPQTITATIPGDPKIPAGWPGNTPTETTFKGRIAHRTERTIPVQMTTAGASAEYEHFLSIPYGVNLSQDVIITDGLGQKYKMSKPDPLRKFGGVYGFTAYLQEID